MRRKIFSVLGVMPEPGGYAAAKFSRTPTYKSYQDWVLELTEEGAGKFYNSMYFNYGHSSIADLAHVMVIFENISMVARHILLDDQLIDAQSRSTRYVDYSKAVFILPPEIKKDKRTRALFQKTVREMVGLYSQLTQAVAELYSQKYASEKPKEMDDEAYLRTVRARANDVSRYLLPCAGPKSMGVLASGRTWERTITKFLSSPLLECREIGKELQKAICQKEAFNVSLAKIERMNWLSAEEKAELKVAIAGKNIALPTLVKYAEKKDYPRNVYGEMAALVGKLRGLREPDGKRGVEMFEGVDPQIDLVTTMFYKATPYSYGQLLRAIKKANKKLIKKAIGLAFELRGEHDQVLREADTATLIFDICMDVGGFRDLHRHRNCIHILKPVTGEYGYDMPKEVKEVGMARVYEKAMEEVWKTYRKIEKKYPGVGEYILPQATRRRFLMKMSPWELQYIAELRTKPQGHFSYREITYLMWQLFNKRYPDWGKYIAVTSPGKVDFFKR
ncbi:MAG TPA: FAD-dependent thymidylate synthase [Patescibacteria group bacterium]|nr:FAD-dependent thymidylate synthase [Patescibacteria group bacterium]